MGGVTECPNCKGHEVTLDGATYTCLQCRYAWHDPRVPRHGGVTCPRCNENDWRLDGDCKECGFNLLNPGHFTPYAHHAAKRVLEGGAKKYPSGVQDGRPASEHVAAALRHIAKWLEGEKVDPDSGENPLAHAAARCMLAYEVEKKGE